MFFLFTFILSYGCSETIEKDPCEGADLPACELPECPENYELSHGDECSEDDADCTTGTGTGRLCQDGEWSVLEPNHGDPNQCNLECVFTEE